LTKFAQKLCARCTVLVYRQKNPNQIKFGYVKI